MKIGIDFGGSLIKILGISDGEIIERKILQTNTVSNFTNFVEEVGRENSAQRLITTGGLAHKINFTEIKFSIDHINEITALGTYLASVCEEPSIITSIGTGTPIILKTSNEISHLGGTGLGGGTIMGLAKRLLGHPTFDQIVSYAESGDKENVNILVKDIVGDGIGTAPRDAIAAYFGKNGDNKADICLSLFHLVLENVIALVAAYSKMHEVSNLYFVGSILKPDLVRHLILESSQRYDIRPCFTENPEYTCLTGALQYFNIIKI